MTVSPLVQYVIRVDLVAEVKRRAASQDTTMSQIVAAALDDYLRLDTPPPALTAAARARLAVRLPDTVRAPVRAQAGRLNVSERLVVEAALARAFAPPRPLGWDPNRPSTPER